MKNFIIIFFTVSLICPFQIHGKGITYKGDPIKNFGNKVDVFSEEGKFSNVTEVITYKDFKPFNAEVINLGVSNSTHWIKFKLTNATKERIALNVAFPLLDEYSFYIFNEAGILIDSNISGIIHPFSERKLNYQDFVDEIPEGKEPMTILLRIRNGSQIILPTEINNVDKIYESFFQKDHFFGIYAGFVLVMLLYNLFIYFSTNDNNYLLYLLYIATVGLVQFTLNGYIFKYVIGDIPYLATNSIYVGGISSGLAVLFFFRHFLHVKENLPWVNKGLNLFILVYLCATISLLFGNANLTYNLINAGASLGSILVLFGAVLIAKKGYRPAVFFSVAWTVFLSSVIVFVLKDLSILPYNNWTAYSMPVGSAIEVVVLAIALADKINILQKETKTSREREVNALKRNEKLIKEQNIVLEQKVEERTTDLKEANKSLNNAMTTLKGAQSQLVSQEKMASLGQLTAGIAHEINNPINFVSSNVNPLRRDIQDLKEIIDKYDEFGEEEQYNEIKKVLDKLKEDIDYNYVLEEIEQLLDGIQEGADRTAEIVQSLKNFSRLDEIASKVADIHTGIDSTIVILKSGTKGKVKITTNYDDKIEPIECYPGKLNQVFSNILVNGIQALTTNQNQKEEPEIVITTKDLGNKISISIKDNGPGIPDAVKEKIFDPFFTTKDVGEGTGLGLSIVFSIIESHHASIDVNSSAGEGTEFLITLPKEIH